MQQDQLTNSLSLEQAMDRLDQLQRRILELEAENHQLQQCYEQELTERQRVEVAIRESEECFRAVFNTAPVMLWMTGVDTLCNFCNQTWLDFTGRTLTQNLSEAWAERLHPEDRQSCVETYLKAFDLQQPFQMEYRVRRADGEYRWILDQGTPRHLENGDFAGYIGSCIDITERKQAELEAARSLSLLQTTLEATADAILVIDLDGKIIHFNHQFVEQWKIPADILAQRDGDLLIAIDQQQLANPEALLAQVRAESLQPDLVSYTVLEFKDGRVFERYSKPQYLGGKIIGRVINTRDISERKRSETEREQTEEALRKSEATNRALINAIPDLMIRMKRDGTYLDFIPSKEFDPVLPHPKVQGETLYDVIPLEIAQERMRYVEQALQTGKTQTYEFELSFDGEIKYQEARIAVSGKDEVLVIVRDVTERE
ncbi:MAG: PAS domain S-box protein, partial [Leptolyngbyaceae bacterium]|nr:PAS domain S-box protein [Leptolyngbyaceae bacterium]